MEAPYNEKGMLLNQVIADVYSQDDVIVKVLESTEEDMVPETAPLSEMKAEGVSLCMAETTYSGAPANAVMAGVEPEQEVPEASSSEEGPEMAAGMAVSSGVDTATNPDPFHVLGTDGVVTNPGLFTVLCTDGVITNPGPIAESLRAPGPMDSHVQCKLPVAVLAREKDREGTSPHRRPKHKGLNKKEKTRARWRDGRRKQSLLAENSNGRRKPKERLKPRTRIWKREGRNGGRKVKMKAHGGSVT